VEKDSQETEGAGERRRRRRRRKEIPGLFVETHSPPSSLLHSLFTLQIKVQGIFFGSFILHHKQ